MVGTIMKNVNEIKDSQLCYGCGTCSVVCNKDAITMQYDNIGRLLPIIDETKCVNCGLCSKICPSLDQKGIQLPDTEDRYVGHVINTYIGKATDEQIFRNSQSGGMVTAVLKYLFDTEKIDAAIVCKVIDEIEYTPKAILITSVTQLYDSQKSSYVPVDMVSAMKQASDYNSIAVVGTGCHIQGFYALKEFKQTYREKIRYTLGLICDRTLCKTSTDVLYGNYFKNEKKRVVWRDKSVGYKEARLVIKTEDGRQKVLPRWKRFALKDPFTNPRCRICFDKLNTHADIVYGDPWGMSNIDWKNGLSLVLTRTKTGEEIINNMKRQGDAILNEPPLSEVIQGQNINKRKQSVAVALTVYKQKGWHIPTYAEQLGIDDIHIKDKELQLQEQMISKFVKDARKNKDEIVKANLSMLRMHSLRNSKPFYIVRRIVNYLKKIV